MNSLKAAYRIAWKDVLGEVRNRETIGSMFFFSLLVILVFHLSLSLNRETTLAVAPGLLWLALTFTSLLGLGKAFAAEQENECLEGLVLAPIPRAGIYLGKLLGNLAFLAAVEAVLLPLFLALQNMAVGTGLPALLLVLLLGSLGLSILGTLFSALTTHVRAREVMLPLLLLPLAVPLLIGAVQATGAVLRQEPWSAFGHWIRLLGVFDLVFLVVSLWVFPYLIEE